MALLFFLFSFPIILSVTRNLLSAVLLVFAPEAAGGIGLSYMILVIPNASLLSVLLTISSICAISALFWHKFNGAGILMLLLPQQIFLVISAIGASIAVFLGHYPDGVFRSHWFILDDQLPRISVALIHFAAAFGLSRIRY